MKEKNLPDDNDSKSIEKLTQEINVIIEKLEKQEDLNIFSKYYDIPIPIKVLVSLFSISFISQKDNFKNLKIKKYNKTMVIILFVFIVYVNYWLISSQSPSSWVSIILFVLSIFCCLSCKYKLFTEA